MNLREWHSNSKEFENSSDLEDSPEGQLVKVLGIPQAKSKGGF